VFQAIEEIAKVLLTNIADRQTEDSAIKPHETEKIKKKKCCDF
jgi:hypothetical protein